MRRIFTYLSICIAAIAAMAQNKADIEVSYTALSPNFGDGKIDVKHHYVLLANTAESKFFSPVTEYIDSLNSTPEGVAKWKEMALAAFMGGKMDDIPRRDGSCYVVKYLSDNTMRCYDSAGLDKYYYDEPIDEISWEISDSTKTVLGCECVKASADFHGRKWIVWFSPEIPVANGPWKLGGLPGLILEAVTADGQYSFIPTGIEGTSKAILPVYLAHEYEKTTRESFLKAKRAFIDNPMGQINAQFGGDIKISGDTDDKIFGSSDVVDFIETDYR